MDYHGPMDCYLCSSPDIADCRGTVDCYLCSSPEIAVCTDCHGPMD